jgi:hypothetical protein
MAPTVLHKAMGDHLDRVHSDQKVLKMIRQGGWSLFIVGQESQDELNRLSGSSLLRPDGSRGGQMGAGLCEQRLYSCG